MKKTFTIIILLIIASGNINAVNNNVLDSLLIELNSEKIDTAKVTILNEISQEYLKTDFNNALNYAEKALTLAKQTNHKQSIAMSYTYMAYAQYRLTKYEDAKININKSLTIYEIIDDKLKISKCYSFISQIHYAKQEYNNAIEWVNKSIQIKLDNKLTNELEINYLTLGAIRQKQGKYKLALENFFEAVEFYDKNNNADSKASVYNNIAVTYRKLDNNKPAEEYYKKSLDLYIKNNNKFGELKIYNNLAVLYEKEELTEKAILNYNKVLELSKEVNYQGGIAMSQINLAGIYIESGKNLETAFKQLRESEQICIKTSDNFKLAFVYGLLGQFYEKKNNLAKAIFHTKKAYDITTEIKASEGISDMSLQLSELYKKQNDYKNSLKYFEIYHTTNDSIFNIEKTSVIEEMKTKFEISNKEKELEFSNQKLMLFEKKEKINKIKNYALSIVLILILILTILTIIFFKNKINRDKELSEKNNKIAEAEKKMLSLEIKNKEVEKNRLSKELEYKNKELQNFAHYIVDKNEFIIKIQKDLKKVKKNISEQNIDNSLQIILTEINNKIQLVRNSEEFLAHVDQINSNFYFKLKENHPKISENEQRLASLLKIGLSSKDIASILYITPKSVDTNRYRLRKKLEMNQDINLHEYFKNL